MSMIKASDYATQKFNDKETSDYVKLTAGRKEMVPVGAAYKMKNDKKVLEIGFVCLEDLEKTSEEGAIFFEQFYLTEKALWRLSNWVMAMNYTGAFDPHSLEHIKKIMLQGCFVAVFEDREYTNNNGDLVKFLSLKWFNRTRKNRNQEDGVVDFSDEQIDFISKAEKSYASLVKYKIENYGDKYITSSSVENKGEDYDEYEEIPF